jgi:hypothetical protein
LFDRRRDELGVLNRGERHEENAVAELIRQLGRDLEREPRLPASTRAGHGHKPRSVPEQLTQLGQLLLPADERRRGDGQVRPVEALQRGKSSSPSW